MSFELAQRHYDRQSEADTFERAVDVIEYEPTDAELRANASFDAIFTDPRGFLNEQALEAEGESPIMNTITFQSAITVTRNGEDAEQDVQVHAVKYRAELPHFQGGVQVEQVLWLTPDGPSDITDTLDDADLFRLEEQAEDKFRELHATTVDRDAAMAEDAHDARMEMLRAEQVTSKAE